MARLSATHKRAQTVSGPPQSPNRSLEGSGSQTDPLTPWYNGLCVPHGGPPRRRRVVYQTVPAKNPSCQPYNVAAGHSRRSSLRVSHVECWRVEEVLQERRCFGGCIGHPLPQGALKRGFIKTGNLLHGRDPAALAEHIPELMDCTGPSEMSLPDGLAHMRME